MSRSVWHWLALLAMAIACEMDDRRFGSAGEPQTSIEGNDPTGADAGDASATGAGGPGEGGGLVATPERVDFGPVPLGFAAPARVDLANLGQTAVAISEITLTSAEFLITQNSCAAELGPMESCSVGLAFQPAQVGPKAASLQVATGAATVLSVPLQGEAIELSPFILEAAPENATSFGDVLVNAERVQAFRLTNPTTETSGVLDFSLSHPAFSLLPPDPTIPGCTPQVTTLTGGASCDVRVRFAPAERGAVEATLTARIGNAATSLNLSGNGLIPALLGVSITQIDFGPVEREGTSALEVAIQNAGDQDLAPVTATISSGDTAEFAIIANGCTQALAPAGTCNVSVSFTPLQSGARNATLQLDAGAAGSAEVTLAGQGVEPGDLLLSAADGSSTSFGSALIDEAIEQTFRVTNPGDIPTGIITFAVNSNEFSLVPPSGTDCVSGTTDLAGGADCDIRIQFVPAQRQQRNATLTVSSESLGSKSMNLGGIGLAPAELDADEVADFGRISETATATRSITVANLGDQPLGAITATLTGQHRTDFIIDENGCGPGLGFGDTCDIAIGFDPAGTGSRLATLRVQSTPGGSREVRLQGTGLVPGALALTPAAGSNTEFTMSLVLGSGESQTQSFVLTNAGEVPSGAINVPPLGNGFQILSPTGTDCRSNSTNLEGGATCTIRVQFTPAVRGVNQSSLSVGSPSAGSASLGLRGTGLAAASLSAEPQQITFATPVTVDQSAVQTLTLRNQGDAPAVAPTTQILGPNGSEFTIDSNSCTAALGGGASCIIGIEFAPRGSATRAATLRLRSAAGNIDVALAGTGQRPGALALQGSPGNPNFGTLAVDASRVETFTLSNTGDLTSGRIVSITLDTGFSREAASGTDCNPGTTVLAGGASCTIRVRFQPRTAGPFRITMSVSSQSAGNVGLELTGVGQAPALLQGASQLSFAATEVLQESDAIEWVVTNRGGTATGQLVLANNSTVRTEFVTTNGCSGTLAAGSACTIVIRFRPSVPGERLGAFRLSAPQIAALDLSLVGIGECPTGSEDDGGVCRKSNGQPCSVRTECATDICSTMFPDDDEDGFGDEFATAIRECGPIPVGRAANNEDCCDLDPAANPNETNLHPVANRCGDFDYNCNGAPEGNAVLASPCTTFPNCVSGWVTLPPCGSSGDHHICTSATMSCGPGCGTVTRCVGIGAAQVDPIRACN